jgi:hypothetical protein
MRKLLAGALLCALALVSVATAETIQKGSLRVAFDGSISPKKLPRHGTAPVAVEVGTQISVPEGKQLPQLTEIEIAINRHGVLDSTGLPVCEMDDIQPATTAKALAACRGALVGDGSFSAEVALSRQAAFPSEGKLYAFNGVYEGKPAILAHVYGDEPVPTSFTLPFVISKRGGTYGTVLTARIPAAENNAVTGIELRLKRTYSYRGKRRSYASAGCPAAKGFPGATFSFAKVSFSFKGQSLDPPPLRRSCRARG